MNMDQSSGPEGTDRGPLPDTAQRQVNIAVPPVKPIVTYALMGVTILIYLLQQVTQSLMGTDIPVLLGAKINQYILQGELWRLITPVFLHGSIFHIGFNMYALYVIGVGLERQYGNKRYLLLYFLGGFAGNVFSFMFSSAAAIGASTAIFGLLGAEGVFIYQNRRFFGNRARSMLINIVTIAAINLVIGLSPGIDNWGHLGGLIGGTVFAWLGGPLWDVEGIFPNFHLKDKRSGTQILTAALTVLIFFGLVTALRFIQR